jgi:hypothetical protein
MLTEAESASSPAVVVGMSAPPRTRLAPWQGARWPPPRHCARPDRRSGDRGLPSLPPPSCRRGAPLRRTLRSVLPGRSAPGTIEGAPDAPGPTNTRARAHHGQRPTSVPATRPTLPQVSSTRVGHAGGELIWPGNHATWPSRPWRRCRPHPSRRHEPPRTASRRLRRPKPVRSGACTVEGWGAGTPRPPPGRSRGPGLGDHPAMDDEGLAFVRPGGGGGAVIRRAATLRAGAHRSSSCSRVASPAHRPRPPRPRRPRRRSSAFASRLVQQARRARSGCARV